jgi:4,5-dihydroxyphthalate decarboxylase
VANLSITIACGNYDRTLPIKDGRVPVEGCDVTFVGLEPEEMFFRSLRYQEFDVAELSFNSCMMLLARGECPYVLVPAFPSRIFRHSSIFIRTDRGLKAPHDLKGRLVGMPEYQQTANVWVRGMLSDEYGVAPEDVRWRTGGLEEPGRDERTPLIMRKKQELDLEAISQDRTLSDMLRTGEIDAIVSARPPSVFLSGAPNIGRLFPDYPEAEQAYFRKTGLFPIMHVTGVRRTLVSRYPWLPGSVYKAFLQAKELAIRALVERGSLRVTLPWIEFYVDRARDVIGADYWPYGVAENRRTIETLLRYSWDQGLLARQLAINDLFAESTLELSKI